MAPLQFLLHIGVVALILGSFNAVKVEGKKNEADTAVVPPMHKAGGIGRATRSVGNIINACSLVSDFSTKVDQWNKDAKEGKKQKLQKKVCCDFYKNEDCEQDRREDLNEKIKEECKEFSVTRNCDINTASSTAVLSFWIVLTCLSISLMSS